ncbi:MAG TPA: ribonuclease HII [Nanoarchaeota archaeon]|nr:ribonuclease HII [Nanoarchaeota archaeon]
MRDRVDGGGRDGEEKENVLGIDDSGRGPVIGPMVMAGVKVPAFMQEKFRELGVKDSKKLTASQREKLGEMIRKNSEFSIIRIWPYEIDFGNEAGINLNKLEAIKSAQIINDLKPDKAIIDCPSPNIPRWQAEVEKRLQLQKPCKVVCEHKADVNHPVVSAASIIAKVARDEEIAKIQKRIPEEIGSGYTSDPITVKFLEGNWEKYRDIFRQSWSTWQNHKNKKDQKEIFEYEGKDKEEQQF